MSGIIYDTKIKEGYTFNCQLGDTYFTHVVAIGNLSTNRDLVLKCIDRDDFITALFHTGQPLHGGD